MAVSERGCCVPRCGKTSKDHTVLHSFPNPDQDMDRYLAWIYRAVGIDKLALDPHYVYKNRRVCHDHFEPKFLTWTRRLFPGAVPTLLLSGSETVRVPLMEITNRNQNVLLDTALPSTSKGEPSAHVTGESLAQVVGEPVAQLEGKQQKLKLKNPTLAQKTFDGKQLIKVVNKLQMKKDRYARRLKKALTLSENKTFQNTLKKFTALAAMFTLMQFREITKNEMGRRFTEPEKIMALSLYKRSPRPSSMTLSRLIARASLKPGLNENLFQQLKRRVDKMKADEKLCTLLFDEMSIAPHVDYNQRKYEITGFTVLD